MNHSLLAPSSAKEWVPCPGSVQMKLMYPSTRDQTAATVGSIVHDIAADLIQVVTKGWKPGRESSKILGTVIKGVLITMEMIDGALMYAKHVEKAIQYSKVFGGPHLAIERRLAIPEIHETCFGKPDAWLYDKHEDVLHLWDFKYGYRIVEVFENWQSLSYVSGIISELGLTPSKIFINIIQPRAPHKHGPIRTWTIDNPAKLEPYFQRLKDSAELALSANPPTVSGPHCRDCSALLNCETARKMEFNVLEFIGDLTSSRVNDDSLWYELYLLEQAKDIVKHRITALETEVKAKLQSGVRVPHYNLEDTYGHLEWTIPHEEIIQLGSAFEMDLNVPKTMTPTQAKAHGFPVDTLECFTERKRRGSKLTFDDLSQARYIFDANKE